MVTLEQPVRLAEHGIARPVWLAKHRGERDRQRRDRSAAADVLAGKARLPVAGIMAADDLAEPRDRSRRVGPVVAIAVDLGLEGELSAP
jgi:hypothetical protein